MYHRVLSRLLVLALLVSVTELPSESASKLYQDGVAALSRGDRENARFYFRRALEINPSYREAALADGDLSLQLGDLARARQSYERVLTQEAENTRALIGNARVLTISGNLSAADVVLKKAEARDPSNENALHARGDLHWRMGRKDLAAGYFERALKKNPLHLPSLLSLAVLETDRSRTQKAAGYIARARRIDPENPEVHLAEGDIAFRRLLTEKDPVERKRLVEIGKRSYRTALDISEDNVPAQKNLILLEMYSGTTGETLSRVRSLIEQEPQNAQWQYLSAVLSGGKQPAEALYGFQQALRLAPEDSLIRYRYEQFLAANESTGGLEARRKVGKFHLNLMQFATRAGRTDLRDFHARRALVFMPGKETLNIEIEKATREGNYEGYLAGLLRLREMDNSPSVQFRIDEALRQKNRDLAMRENLLTISNNGSRANVIRTPHRILVFDFKSENPFPRIPDAGEVLSMALRDHLTVKVVPAPETFRKKLFETIRRVEGIQGPVPYSPEAMRFLNDKDETVSAIVAGSFSLREKGARVKFEVYDRRGGRILDRFETTEDGEDALHRICARAASRIANLLPAAGQVVRVSGTSIYLNAGKSDGLNKGDWLEVERAGHVVGKLRVEETSFYVSRAATERGLSPSAIFSGDRVQKVAAPASNANR
ncbi:MAG: tetratricopeptide repeat protein [Leptospirales bacterium]|nr:tetratricopeptide repeat protein [Leptospirales bacterium]